MSAHVVLDPNQAAASGDIELLRQLTLAQLVASKDNRGWCPLHHASAKGQTGVVEHLLSIGLCDPLDKDMNTALHRGINHPDTLEILLKAEPLLNLKDAQNRHGCTAIMLAAASGRSRSVELLLAAGASIKLTSKQGLNALELAVQNGQISMVEVLLKSPVISGDIPMDTGRGSPFHLASRLGHLEIVQLLLTHDVDVNSRIESGATALWEAAANGHSDVVELLLNTGASITSAVTDNTAGKFNGTSAVFEAAKCGHSSVVQQLVQRMQASGARSSLSKLMMRTFGREKMTSFHVAAANGHVSVLAELRRVEEVLEATPAPLTRRATAISIASSSSRPSNVAEGSTLSATASKKRTAIHIAAQHSNSNTVEWLADKMFEAGVANSDESGGCSALHIAAENGDIVSMRAIMGNDPLNIYRIGWARIGSRDKKGETALLKACRGGHLECVSLLLKMYAADSSITGLANTFSTNDEPTSPLFEAIRYNHASVVEKLLESRLIDPAQLDTQGFSPLHIAAFHNSVEILSMLLRNGIPADLTGGPTEATPLLQSCWYGQLESFNLLRKFGANVTAADKNGNSALHIAAESGVAPNQCVSAFINEFGVDAACSVKNNDRESPLLVAARLNHVDFCRMLITEFNCSVTQQDAVGISVLHHACRNGNIDLVKILRNIPTWDLLIQTSDSQGRTPIFMAAASASVDLITLLLEAGARANQQTAEPVGKESLLHYALSLHMGDTDDRQDGCDYLQVLAVLLRKGIPATLLNALGKTAYDIAKDSQVHAACAVFEGGY